MKNEILIEICQPDTDSVPSSHKIKGLDIHHFVIQNPQKNSGVKVPPGPG